MPWNVVFHPAFARDYQNLARAVQDELAAFLVYLRETGPALGRPHADTLKGSKHRNMKELRFAADDGVWRVAFDPERRAVVLVAGDKTGVDQRRFYKSLIAIADRRFDEHLARME